LFQTEIRAPFDGTITGRKVDPGSNLTAGQEVVELQTTDWLFGTTNFPIEFSKDIKVGTPATILIDGLSSEVGKGEIVMPNKTCKCFYRGSCVDGTSCMEDLPAQKIAEAVERHF
jgi:hypothetical protein